LPFCGELEEHDRTDRQDARERQGWRNNTHLGIVVHHRGCEVCNQYALHVYQHEFKLDHKYLNAKEHRNKDFTVESCTAVKRAYEEYEDEIDDLKDKIDRLEDKLDRMQEDCPVKRSHVHKHSPVPDPMARGFTHASAPSHLVHPPTIHPMAEAMD
jgi:hypothetical protein